MDTTTSTGHTGGDPDPAAGPARSGGFFAAVRRTGLFRADDRWIGGVCGGLAARFGIDTMLVRGLFAVTVLLGGLGLILYGVAWALLPEQRDGRIHVEEMLAGRFDVALLGAFAFVLVGLGRGDHWFWFWAGPPGWLQGLLWLAFVVAVVTLVVVAISRRPPRPPSPPASGPSPYGPFPASGSWPAGAQPGRPTTTAYAPGHPGASTTGSTMPTPPDTAPTGSPAGPAGTYTTPTGPHAGPSGPGWTPPPAPPTRPIPPVPPVPPTPRRARRGPGAATVGVVVGLSILGLAALLVAERTGAYDGPVLLTALGIAIVLAGLGIIVSGLRGRSSGTLGFLAIVAVLVALPVGAVHGDRWVWSDGHRRTVPSDVVVQDRQTAADGYTLGLGDTTVDLTEVPLTDEPLDVPVSLGAGDLTVLVPADASVEADVRAGAGSVTWDVGDDHRRQDGIGLGRTTFRDGEAERGQAQLRLHVSIGAGDVLITEEER